MREHELNHYHEALLELRSRLTDKIRKTVSRVAAKGPASGEGSVPPTYPPDRDGEGLDCDLALETNCEQMLTTVDAALKRIDDGSYGRCADCGIEIEKQRLDVLPSAIRCLACEERRERK